VLAPNAARWDAQSIFPKEALAAAGELGFMGMYTPEAAGGLALSRLDASLIVEELARGCTTTAAFLTIHNMATSMIGRYCSEAVIEAGAPASLWAASWPPTASRSPGPGSDAASLRTRAERDGDDYVINGSKVFISGAGETDVLVVMLRTGDDGPEGHHRLARARRYARASAMARKKRRWAGTPNRRAWSASTDVRVPVAQPSR
jgi:alkylation response protein AidB-like acyl-CoA dehydrogenase